MSDGLGGILDHLKGASEGGKTTLGDVLDAFESRSLGAILAVLGIIALIPVIGAVPGASIVIGTLVLIAVGSRWLGDGSLWAPSFLRERGMDDEKFDRGVEKVRPWAQRIDAVLRERVSWAARPLPAALCAATLALLFYPMAVVPWGVMVPAGGVTLLGLGLIGKDGAFCLAGYALAAAAAGLAVWYLL